MLPVTKTGQPGCTSGGLEEAAERRARAAEVVREVDALRIEITGKREDVLANYSVRFGAQYT